MEVKVSNVQFSPANRPKKILKRQAIMEAAIDVFGKNSFQSANISEIAKRAGVAEGTIYQYFKNKEDLFFSIPVEKTKDFCRDLDLHLEGITGRIQPNQKIHLVLPLFF